MNKKVVGVVVVVVVVLLVASAFFMMKKSGGERVVQDAVMERALDAPAMETGDAPKKLGFADFLTTTGATSCSVIAQEGTYNVKTDGKRARIETMTTSAGSGVSVNTTMINDGRYMYMWTTATGDQQGIKMDLESETFKKATAPTATGEEGQYKEADWQNWAQSLEATGASYTCDAATVTDADFLPPADVTFMDMEALTKQMESLTKSMPADAGATSAGY